MVERHVMQKISDWIFQVFFLNLKATAGVGGNCRISPFSDSPDLNSLSKLL